MLILGVHSGNHDACAALYDDYRLVAAVALTHAAPPANTKPTKELGFQGVREMTLSENVIFSLRVAGRNKKSELDEVVERSLNGAALWDEVKDRLHESAYGLSGGQQQRLCIARAIANRPQILLMDEPCAALDPIATLRIEELMLDLKKEFTIVIVTHNMQQASRCSDRTAFMYLGRLVEFGDTDQIFQAPTHSQTEAYITGRFS